MSARIGVLNAWARTDVFNCAASRLGSSRTRNLTPPFAILAATKPHHTNLHLHIQVMNLFLTTLLALAASSAIATVTATDAQAFGEAPFNHSTDARQLRVFGRRSGTGGASGSTPSTGGGSINVGTVRPAGGLRRGDAFDGTVASMGLASAVLPLVPAPGSKNPCRQVACWIATTTENCANAAANKVQADVMRGRDAFTVESKGDSGMWVRYWRTQFMPPGQGQVAEGECGGDSKFVVTNCQAAGEVKC